MAQQTQGWHVAKWGLWGWIETGLKIVGIIAGIIAFLSSSSVSELTIGGHPHLAAVILLALLTLLTVGVVFIRVQQREIISVVYSVFNFLGHAALLIAFLRVPDQRTYAIILGVFYALGELSKQRFLAITGYTENGMALGSMVNFSRGLMAIYIVFVILVLL
ncbi:MAG: hypothetical protein ABI690_12850 [Chloroflexota bacterium]